MNTIDISTEDKHALANLALQKARGRLSRDGCCTIEAMQRRVMVLAAERNLLPADFAKLMHKRVPDRSIHEFCSKHNVSLDWLMCGDLKGLQRMTQWAKEQDGATADRQRTKITRLLLALPPAKQRLAMKLISELGGSSNE